MKKKDYVPICTPIKKLLRIMRITAFLLLAFCIHLSASSLGQTKVSLKMKSTFGEVVEQLEKASEYRFVIKSDEPILEKQVEVSFYNKGMDKVLDELLYGTGYQYRIIDRYIAISPVETSSEQQQKSVTGKITDESGEPLPGVTVVIKGTTKGVVSDMNGRYIISDVSSEEVLVFSFVGMKTQEIEVGEQSSINITMTVDAIGIDEVVAVGYGVQKKISVTNAVGVVDQETLQNTNVSDIRKTLQGQVAGLSIIDRGGAPGFNNMTMRIRGITSINGNEPLVIIDGVELKTTNGSNALGALNPDDIESISVLKDASSTAIYGSRAANGVILVTTKKPEKGALNVSYHGYFSMSRQNNKFEHMDVEPYMHMQNAGFANAGLSEPYTDEYINEYANATDRVKYPLPNVWQDYIYSKAPVWNHAISLDGGTDNIQTRFSFRYKDEEGVVINTGADQYEMRSFTNFNINDRLKFSANLQYRQMESYGPNWLTGWGGVIYRSFQDSQWAVPTYPDGTYGVSTGGQSPLIMANLVGERKSSNKEGLGIFRVEYEPIEDLILSAQYAPNYSWFDQSTYNHQYQVFDYYDKSKVVKSNYYNNMVVENQSFYSSTLDLVGNYAKSINDKHNLKILGGFQQIKHDFRSLQGERHDFYNNDITELSQGANDGRQRAYGDVYDYALRSVFGRVNYDYKNKLLFEGNIRYDGSSRFAEDNRYGLFPSFSGGYRMAEEGFWQPFKSIINELKIRASWGQVGNQQVGLYTFIPTYDQHTVILGEELATGYAQTSAVSDELSWETTTQTNIGLDLGFLNNKYTLGVDYYYKRTEDILLYLPIPDVMGLYSTAQNAGAMDNKGWELLATAKYVFNGWKFNASATADFLENEIIDLAKSGPYLQGIYIQKEGFAYNTYYGFKTDGIFQTEEEVNSSPVRWSNTAPGDLKYVDVNEDGVINDSDKVELGSNTPEVSYSANLDISYKNFTLNMMFQGVAGNKVALDGALIEMGNWNGFTHAAFTDNYWTPENTDAFYPRPYKYSTRNTELYDNLVVDGSYFRLKNVKLAYDVPNRFLDNSGFERLNVYFSMTNLFTISKLYREFDLDPESHIRAAEYNYPQISTTTLGLNLTF